MEPFFLSPLRIGERWLHFDEPVIMGVVNVTPDSFSAGHTTDTAAAIAHGVQLWRDGAAILDIGGEATNPKAQPINAQEEWARIEPVVRGLAAVTTAILSVDTTKAEVAARAVAAGATIVNDVSGGRFDAAMIETVAELVRTHHVAYVASHLRGRSISEVFSAEAPEGQEGHVAVAIAGSPLTKQVVLAELVEQVVALPAAVREAAIVDPGLGFGKGAGELNLELMVSGGELARATGRPVLIGPSRKRFLRRVLPASATAQDVDSATVGAALAAVRGGAQLLRIHAVALLRPALAVYIRK